MKRKMKSNINVFGILLLLQLLEIGLSLGKTKKINSTEYRPIVIWHGMGDSCCNENSLGEFMNEIEDLLPGVFVYSLNVSNSDSEMVERKNSYFGNLNEQVDYVCQRLKEDDIYKLLKPNGFNAIGFSQGSQFLRAYVERCNDPPVYNLISYGGQHNGVADIPGCLEDSVFCQRMRYLVRKNVYSPQIQNNVIQAQYFKSIDNYEEYLEKSIFLSDINNEKKVKNSKYRDNMILLNNFVMIKFENELLVVPESSSWFGWIDEEGNIIQLNKTEGYQNDWVGLKTLDENNKLKLLVAPGNHMEISMEYFIENVLDPYLNENIGNNNDDDDNDDSSDDDNDSNDDDDIFNKSNDDYILMVQKHY